MKNNRGEISILMIITVICLIVFGGICIFMLTGENGLFIEKGKEQTNNSVETNVQESANNTVDTNNNTEEENNTVVDDKSNETTNEDEVLTVPMQ